MSSAKRILENAQPAVRQLDELIRGMESQLGLAHSVSPFTAIYQKHGFSTITTHSAPEETKEEAPKQEKAAEK